MAEKRQPSRRDFLKIGLGLGAIGSIGGLGMLYNTFNKGTGNLDHSWDAYIANKLGFGSDKEGIRTMHKVMCLALDSEGFQLMGSGKSSPNVPKNLLERMKKSAETVYPGHYRTDDKKTVDAFEERDFVVGFYKKLFEIESTELQNAGIASFLTAYDHWLWLINGEQYTQEHVAIVGNRHPQKTQKMIEDFVPQSFKEQPCGSDRDHYNYLAQEHLKETFKINSFEDFISQFPELAKVFNYKFLNSFGSFENFLKQFPQFATFKDNPMPDEHSWQLPESVGKIIQKEVKECFNKEKKILEEKIDKLFENSHDKIEDLTQKNLAEVIRNPNPNSSYVLDKTKSLPDPGWTDLMKEYRYSSGGPFEANDKRAFINDMARGFDRKTHQPIDLERRVACLTLVTQSSLGSVVLKTSDDVLKMLGYRNIAHELRDPLKKKIEQEIISPMLKKEKLENIVKKTLEKTPSDKSSSVVPSQDKHHASKRPSKGRDNTVA